MIQKHQTACCALCQLTASNEDSYADLKAMVDKIKKSSLLTWHPSNRLGGERAIFAIVAPGEDKLEKNLEKLNFAYVSYFNRRNGYTPGRLAMWLLRF